MLVNFRIFTSPTSFHISHIITLTVPFCRLLNLLTTKGMLITASVFKHNLLGYNSVTMWDNAVTTVITGTLVRWKGNLHIMLAKLTYLKGIIVIKHLVAIVDTHYCICLYMVLTRAAWNMNSGCFVYCDILDQAKACSVCMLSYIFY